MAGQTGLRPVSLTLFLLGAFILFISQSYLSLKPILSQFKQDQTLDKRAASQDSFSADIFDSGLSLVARQAIDDDHTCAIGRECKNGACCGESGNCGYGKRPETQGSGPEDEAQAL